MTMTRVILLLSLLFCFNCYAGVDFDGTNDYIEIVDHNDFTPAGNLSAVAWIRPDGVPVVAGGVISHFWGRNAGSGAIDQRSWALIIVNSGGNTRVQGVVSDDGTFDANFSVTGGTNLTTGVWYHVAMVYTESVDVEVFVNGVSDGTSVSAPANIHNSTQPVRIGLHFWSPGSTDQDDNTMEGVISDAGVYSTAITATQLLNMFNSKMKTEFTLEASSSVIAGWFLDEAEDGAVANITFNDYLGTHNGTGNNGPLGRAETVISYPPPITIGW